VPLYISKPTRNYLSSIIMNEVLQLCPFVEGKRDGKVINGHCQFEHLMNDYTY
jgi:hypothetical protein